MRSSSVFLDDEQVIARLESLVAPAREGHSRSLAQLITAVENDPDVLRELRASLAPFVGHAQVVGITGAPGVGKSTLVNTLIATYRAQGRTVAVLAVDPSSPFSGGALLGDRIRMHDHSGDEGVFIRSLSSRGHLGGLSAATGRLLPLFDAAGFDCVIIETVGVGQSEIDVAGLADTTILVVAPGMGDGVQAAKAGIVEIADIFVVSKSDREGAEATARDLRHTLRDQEAAAWTPPVVLVSAQEGTGFDELHQAIDEHAQFLESSGEKSLRRVRRAREEIMALATDQVHKRWAARESDIEVLAEKVARMELSASEASAVIRGWAV